MPTPEAFSELIRRLRAGDGAAAEELVRHYEPVVRLEVRCRLSDPRLRRVLDTMDISQAVMGSFFVRAAAGQYDIERPEQLVHLLKEMARRKLAFQARHNRAGCRDVRRVEGGGEDWDPAGADPTPSRVLAGRELLEEVRRRLSPEERQLAERRALGQEWQAIATELGGTPGGRRKQLARALDRVAEELGLDSE
jgi:RNA polymerase sigma-70 factor (ECF subfamily)